MKKKLSIVCCAALLLAMVSGCASPAGSSAPASSAAEPTSTAAEAGASTSSDAAWPTGSTVNVHIPAKAGGGTDMVARYLTNGWGTLIDANFVVTNYDTGEVGAQAAAKADPDGMALTIASCVNMDNYLAGSSEVNPVEDLVCIAKITGGGPQVLFTGVDAPYNNLQELKEYAQANPGEVVSGVALGGTSHLMWLNLASAMGGVEFNYVQSASEADKLTNVASGSIDLGNCSLNNAIGYETDNKIKVLAILGHSDEFTRDDYMEGLGDQYLTTKEQGFDGASWYAGNYVVGPAGISDDVLQAINESIGQAVQHESFVEGMEMMSTIIEFKNVQESQADFMEEWELQVKLTTEAGINTRG